MYSLIEKLVRHIAVRLENEYLLYEVFENGETKMIGSNCFTSAPRKEDFYLIHKRDETLETFLVKAVAHPHRSDHAGYIFLERKDNFKI